MKGRRKRKRLVRALSWIVVIGLAGMAALFFYCASLFRELEPFMSQEQGPRSQPSTIYSDIYVVQKDADFANSFLVERLKDLRLPHEANAEKVSWKGREFEYPESILASDSPMRVAPGQRVEVTIDDNRIEKIEVEGNEVDAVALEPTPVAQLAGAARDIREYSKLSEIPTKMLEAIIAIEDQRFLEHPGFDLRSLARAFWVNVRSGSLSQGGSTLTQQLVKNLLGTRQKTLFRKARELILAILMEARYSKDTILEKYLNEVYFGQIGSLEVHGVTEAAKYFFNKPIDQLSLAEMALIAGVIRGPAVYSPYKHPKNALARKDTVLKKMEELRIISKEEYKGATVERLVFAPPSLVNNRAPYFVDYVKSQVLDQLGDRISIEDLSAEGLRIFTTLDLTMQRRADQSVASTVRDLEARYKITRPVRLEGILVAADPKSGYVRALVGGRSYSETTFNRVLNMKRQVGSTFKPIAYLAAFLKGTDSSGAPYTGAYMIDDEPWTYKWQNGRKQWTPHNYEKGFRGKIPLREAFANSVNIPMAKIGVEVGIDRVIEVAHKLGIREALPNVPSLVLGSVDLEPIELLQAYTTFANRGERVELTTVRLVTDNHGAVLASFVPRVDRQFDPLVIDLLNDMLGSVVREGTAKIMPALGYAKVARGKTGTTSFYRDAWFAGFSEGLVAVTWTGFDELRIPDQNDEEGARKFKPPAQLTGAGAALPTWAKFFNAVKPSTTPSQDALAPDSALERIKIDRKSGLRARSYCPDEFVYEELFLPNTAPGSDCNIH